MWNIRPVCRLFSVAALLLPLLSACVPDSRYPLPGSDDGKGDDRLVGRWYFAGEREKGFLEISPSGAGRYQVRFDNRPSERDVEILPTRIGGLLLATLTRYGPPKEGEPSGAPHLIVRYELTDDGDILVYWMERKALAADVRAGLIDGRVEPSELWGETVRLTADSRSLATYLAIADPARIFVVEPVGLRRQ